MKKYMVGGVIVLLVILANTSSTVHYQREENVTYAKGTVTKYAWTGNVMANGQYPYEGAVAVSDYSIPLGTRVRINGREYVVKDRTAKWVHKKRGLTVDIYSKESKKEMLTFGRQSAQIAFITQ